jgi:hypothetical protein
MSKLFGMFLLLALLPMAVAAGQGGGPPGKFPLVETFDYHDFGSGETTQRVYAVTNGAGVTQIVEDIARPPGQVVVTRDYLADTVKVRSQVVTFLATETDLLLVRIENSDGTGTLQSTSEFEPPLSIRQSNMPLGAMQASAAVLLRTPAGSPDASEEGVTRWNVALGLEDVSLPDYGDLAGTLRILEQHDSNRRMLWFYPGIGPVKRVQSDGGPIWNLTGCTGCP